MNIRRGRQVLYWFYQGSTVQNVPFEAAQALDVAHAKYSHLIERKMSRDAMSFRMESLQFDAICSRCHIIHRSRNELPK